MEIRCRQEDLLFGVQSVDRIVSSRTTLPIIGNILFETTKNGLKLSANNLEMGIEVDIPATVKQDGSVLLPAKMLAGIVSKLPQLEVNIKKNEKGVVRISYKKSHSSINGLSPDEFPVLPKIKDAKSFSIPSKVFIDMVKQTIFAVSQSEDKYVLNGVLIEIGKGVKNDESNIRMVATDGFRLAKIGQNIDGINFETSMIVPSKALNEVVRIVQNAKEDEEIKISFSNEQISFKYKDSYLISRLIQGQFPDYKQVIPKNNDIKITMSTREFLDSTERASVIAGANSNIVKLNIEGEALHIIANTEQGNVDEVVDIEVSGKPKESIAFNVRLLMDVLKVVDSEKIIFEFSGPLSPGVIRPADGKNFLYIIMPIRTTDTSV